MKPEEPPARPVEFYRCPKGHEQYGEQSWQMTPNTPDPKAPSYDTGPLCRTCLFAFFTLTFGTQRQKPPEPPKKKRVRPSRPRRSN